MGSKMKPSATTAQPFTDGEVPEGWSRGCWADRLRYLAEACEGMHPERARELREWARKVNHESNKHD